MALPNVTGTVIAMGYNCHVRVGTNATDAQIIALVASFQANEDFQAQEATCIGNLGPVSIDPQGYTCSITLDGFLPSKKLSTGYYNSADKKAIAEFAPRRSEFMETGTVQKIEYLDFYDKKSGTVLAAFKGALITSNGVSVDGNAYVRNNVQMRALSWEKDHWK